MNYKEFLQNKRFVLESSGFDIDKSDLNPKMYDFQKDITRWALKKGKACVFADCGLGKCHGKGTKILMHDCTVKNVEDVKVGDLLMGDDGTPRKVLSLAHGIDEMYEVKLNNGDKFTCNSAHILSLKMSNRHNGHKKGDVVNIGIEDYLKLPDYAKRNTYKAYKNSLEFEKTEVKFDPYVYGLWLGDGSKNTLSFTINDKDEEIVEYLEKWAESLGLDERVDSGRGCKTYHFNHGKGNKLSYYEKDFVVNSYKGEKRIYNDYLVNERQVRLKVLAGLLDTDGYLIDNCYEIATKFVGLRDDILFLCRSLGLSVTHTIKTVNDVEYYRIYISGDTEKIPCITRKKATRRMQIKNPLVYGMEITPIGTGEYFGFAIDGNHLYMLEDFTVTHNTLIQLEWSQQVHNYTKGKLLILAPLSVCEQTKREGVTFGYDVNICESQDDVKDGINITNYEKLDKFVANEFVGVVLDESSILKSYSGKVRTQIIDCFHEVPYKLACTATPAPNDYMELGNHSEFCGVMTRAEMLSMFFVHDGGETSKWRLKGHAEDVFWQWLATFSVFVDNPNNIGYEIDGYNLPHINIQEIIVDGDTPVTETLTLTERRQARKDSLELRCEQAAELVNNSDKQWLVWCDLNDESHKLHELINESVEVRGSDKDTHKSKSMLDFSKGDIKCLVTKPKIAGFGMNWQNCHNMIFTGLSDSYEQYYQALRRCWRFGQKEQVNVYIIISAKEGCVKENIERKQTDFLKMQSEMTELTKEITKKELKSTCRISTPYEPHTKMELPQWEEFIKGE